MTADARTSKRAQAYPPRHVLFADDGSTHAARARSFALWIAASSGGSATAIYVREPTESQKQAEEKLAPAMAEAAKAGVPCKVLVGRPVGITSPGRRIVAAAKSHKADIIVVGARGSGNARKLLGSVSSYVVTQVPMSVCVIR